MNIPLLAVTLAGALAGSAHAQPGFRGVEQLGPGLKARVHLEMHYEPDTGTVEGGVRPLFQGQSRVGLQGSFGTLRIGRGTTSYMESVIAFEPFHGIASPLDATGNAFNRISNAVFYNTPELHGLQFNATLATTKANGGAPVIGRGSALLPQYGANSAASANPFSISATCRDRGHTMARNESTKAWVLGANYTAAGGIVLIGYGRRTPEGTTRTEQLSIGYGHALSKRSYLYADALQKKIAATVNHFDIGSRASF